jgi:hypothetical protein
MKSILKLLIVLLALSVVLAACSGGGSGSGGGGTAAGTFTKQFGVTVSNTNNYPFSGDNDTKTQFLYTAAEIGGSGKITKILMRQAFATGAAVTCPNTTVKMGHTGLAALTTTFSGATGNVQQGKGSELIVLNNKTLTIPIAAAASWIEIPLDTPFDYNGVDNLVVDFERTTKCTVDVATTVFNSAGRRAWSAATDTTAGVAQYDATTAIAVDNVQPWMRFVFTGGDDSILYGGGSSNVIPFNSIDPDMQKIQLLYTSSEINGSGRITGIGFPLASLSTTQTYLVTIRLGHSTLTNLVTTSWAANFNSGSPVTVTSGQSFKVPAGVPAGEYIWLPLLNAFNYNGTDNLVVEIEVSSPTGSTGWRYLDPGSGPYARVYGNVTAPFGRSYIQYDIKFRFAGGAMDVISTGGGGTFVFDTSASGRQFLLRAAELGTSGSINKLACRLNYASPNISYPNFTVTLAHRTQNTLDAVDANNIAGGTLVYTGTFVSPSGQQEGDWIEIPFSTPFIYNGVDNLVIQTTTGAGSNVNSCQISLWDATWFADRTKVVGGATLGYRGNFRFWVNK